jgi:hypothetical protein
MWHRLLSSCRLLHPAPPPPPPPQSLIDRGEAWRAQMQAVVANRSSLKRVSCVGLACGCCMGAERRLAVCIGCSVAQQKATVTSITLGEP